MDEKQFASLPSKTIFIKLVIPSMISMIFSSIYFIFDGIFVGKFIGSEALAAVNIVGPVFSIIFASSNMIAVGSSVKVSIALGKKDFHQASRIFSTSLLTISLLGLFLGIVFLMFENPILTLLINDDSLKVMAKKYVNIFVYFLPFIMPLFAMDNFTRACGKAKYNMYVNVFTSLINILLDFILLYVFKKGIIFAALASCVSMVIGAIWLYLPFILKKNTLRFIKPDLPLNELLAIIHLGVSDFLNSSAGGILDIIINILLLKYGGVNGVASYGIIMYIGSLFFSIIYGMSDAVTPAVSYNYGAKNIKKTRELYQICRAFAVAIALILLITLQLFPVAIASLFIKSNNVELINISVVAIRITALSYLFSSMNIVYSSFMVAFNMARVANILMLLKSIIFPIVTMFILINIFKLNGIFLSTTISAILTFIFASFFWHQVQNNIVEI